MPILKVGLLLVGATRLGEELIGFLEPFDFLIPRLQGLGQLLCPLLYPVFLVSDLD